MVATASTDGAAPTAECTPSMTLASGASAWQSGHASQPTSQQRQAAPIGRHASARLVGQVGAGPGAGHGRQVVGGDPAHRLPRPSPRRARLEEREARGQHVGGGEATPYPGRHRAQILADDHGAGALRLDGQHRQQLVGWLADVGAFGGIRAIGHPPLAKQAQHVVDAQAAAVRDGRPDRVR